MTKRGQRVGGLAGLADEDRHRGGRQDRLAVAEFRGDIDVGGQAGDLFEPVFCDMASKGCRATGNQSDPVDICEIKALRKVQASACSGVVLQRIGDDDGLLGDFLGHEMLVPGLFDPGCIQRHLGHGAARAAAFMVEDFDRLARDTDHIAVFQIGKPVGHRRQGQRVRADEILALAIAHGQGCAVAGTDHQVAFAVEQKAKRESPAQAAGRALDGSKRIVALIHMMAGQDHHRFRVGLRFEPMAKCLHFLANFTEILDDAIVDDGHLARPVRMCVRNGHAAMGRPAGLADATFPGKGFMHQKVREIDQLAHRPTTIQPTVVHRGNPGAVIAPVFQAFQGLDQKRGNFVVS